MPNWCMNTLNISGPKGSITKLKKLVDSPEADTEFSLEKILPTPPEHLSTGHYTDPDYVPNHSWYQWRLDHWGTKWDVEGTLDDWEDTWLTYQFHSAWEPPSFAVHRLAKRYKSCSFNLHWDEPGFDEAGDLTWGGGILIQDHRYNSPTNEAWDEQQKAEELWELDHSGANG